MPLEREYSMEEEREAAEVVYMILVRSKYAPEAMVRFWKRVQGNEALKGKVKRLIRDLALEERVALLEELLPKYAGGRELKDNEQAAETVETGINHLLLTGASQDVDKEPGRETFGLP